MSVSRQLCGALARSARAAGVAMTVVDAESVPWASGLFEGERHEIAAVAAPSTALDAWLESLPGGEWSVGGHIVEDVLVAPGPGSDAHRQFRIEALTIAVSVD